MSFAYRTYKITVNIITVMLTMRKYFNLRTCQENKKIVVTVDHDQFRI